MMRISFTSRSSFWPSAAVAACLTRVCAQYLSLGGPSDPKAVLRGFDDVALGPGETRQIELELTRRDICNWDTVTQDWLFTSYPKVVHVGASSRDIRLTGTLELPAGGL